MFWKCKLTVLKRWGEFPPFSEKKKKKKKCVRKNARSLQIPGLAPWKGWFGKTSETNSQLFGSKFHRSKRMLQSKTCRSKILARSGDHEKLARWGGGDLDLDHMFHRIRTFRTFLWELCSFWSLCPLRCLAFFRKIPDRDGRKMPEFTFFCTGSPRKNRSWISIMIWVETICPDLDLNLDLFRTFFRFSFEISNSILSTHPPHESDAYFSKESEKDLLHEDLFFLQKRLLRFIYTMKYSIRIENRPPYWKRTRTSEFYDVINSQNDVMKFAQD